MRGAVDYHRKQDGNENQINEDKSPAQIDK